MRDRYSGRGLVFSRSYSMPYDRLLASLCCLSVNVMPCTVAKWYILHQKCLNKWTVILILFALYHITVCSSAECCLLLAAMHTLLSTAVLATMRVWPVLLCWISPVSGVTYELLYMSADVWNRVVCILELLFIRYVPLLYIGAVHTFRNWQYYQFYVYSLVFIVFLLFSSLYVCHVYDRYDK